MNDPVYNLLCDMFPGHLWKMPEEKDTWLDVRRRITVGLGHVVLLRNKHVVFDWFAYNDAVGTPTLSDVDGLIQFDNGPQWLLVFDEPDNGECYRRVCNNKWLLTHESDGFV